MKPYHLFLVAMMIVAGLFGVYSMSGIPAWVFPVVVVLVGVLGLLFGYFAAGSRK